MFRCNILEEIIGFAWNGYSMGTQFWQESLYELRSKCRFLRGDIYHRLSSHYYSIIAEWYCIHGANCGTSTLMLSNLLLCDLRNQMLKPYINFRHLLTLSPSLSTSSLAHNPNFDLQSVKITQFTQVKHRPSKLDLQLPQMSQKSLRTYYNKPPTLRRLHFRCWFQFGRLFAYSGQLQHPR